MIPVILAVMLCSPQEPRTVTETIQVKNNRVDMIAHWLGLSFDPPTSVRASAPGRPPADAISEAGMFDRFPPGLTSWILEEATNSVTLTGSPEAVAEIKKRFGLLDVPVWLVRMKMDVLSVDERTLRAAGFAAELEGSANSQFFTAGGTDANVRAEALLKGSLPLSSASASTPNNQPLHHYWSAQDQKGLTTVTPRVNGDGSISLSASMLLRQAAGDGPKQAGFSASRRVKPGEPLILVVKASTVIIIRPINMIK
jgi:hypothetical protein